MENNTHNIRKERQTPTLAAAAMSRLITARQITTPTFRLPVTTSEAELLLHRAYAVEVARRGMGLRPDADTRLHLRRMAEALTADHPRGGLFLCGPCGNGKTTSLLALQRVIATLASVSAFDEAYPEARGSFSFGLRIVDARDVLSMARDARHMGLLRTETLLALEDLGREATEVMDFGNVLSPVVELLEYRYARQLFTVITTNLSPEDFSRKYGERIADRMREMMTRIVFANGSYRAGR
jgi:DNA replication protein DnaC